MPEKAILRKSPFRLELLTRREIDVLSALKGEALRRILQEKIIALERCVPVATSAQSFQRQKYHSRGGLLLVEEQILKHACCLHSFLFLQRHFIDGSCHLKTGRAIEFRSGKRNLLAVLGV